MTAAIKPWTPDHLQKLFMTAEFLSFTGAKKWIPLIGLYSGMRLAEICSLGSGDVWEVNGIWVFDINEGIRPLKSSAAVRLVPLHPILIENGFLDYASSAKALGNLLFHELEQLNTAPHVFMSEWFQRYCMGCNLVDKGLSFQSFRLLASDTLKQANVPDYIRYSLLGVSNGSCSLQQLLGGIKALEYEVWHDIQLRVRKQRIL